MSSTPQHPRLHSDVPKRIKLLRGKLGLTRQVLADLMNVREALVTNWESGRAVPSRSQLATILRAESMGIDALNGYETPAQSNIPDTFRASARVVATTVEGYRLSQGFAYNPVFATELSLIDPLPHQRIAVYERMLTQNRLRFLLADDAGAGKTIMAGLYIREMLSRRLISRILVVPPAGLIGNWQRELKTLFALPFQIVSGSDARDGNPFVGEDSNQVIISIDTLSGDRMFTRLGEENVEPYDLVIFDEAHKLSADRDYDGRVRKTDRYCLAEALCGVHLSDARWRLPWNSQHVMLLSATPHMGKPTPYYYLWRLLEPEVLATMDAFAELSQEERQHHFIRRTKEEMVRLDGSPIYPMRVSDTLSYDLSQGDVSEQRLYNETTTYINDYYNRAKILNRSAARLVMSVFQRRLASSTFALMRSFERRAEKLASLIQQIESGQMALEDLQRLQSRRTASDVFLSKTADEESEDAETEENERAEDEALTLIASRNLGQLQAELEQVQHLVQLARDVYAVDENGSKLDKLLEVLSHPDYHDQKLIIFTEHRDTLQFLVRRLESLGYGERIASIHGGMPYTDREAQVEFFRKPIDKGGAYVLVATDAAGEGINLQFCWLMVNFDIPWNPARLEQRMGRIHRYGQKHDPVVIMNVSAGKTREGRVLKTLLDKMELIRKEMGSDKVYDSIGKVYEGLSISDYMEQLLGGDASAEIEEEIKSKLTTSLIKKIDAEDVKIYGDRGDVTNELPRLRRTIEQEPYARLLPGYVRQFVEKAAPLVDLAIEGSLDSIFSFRPLKPGALDIILKVMEKYPPELQNHLMVNKPANKDEAIFLHPGEEVFDTLQKHVCVRYANDALSGASFIDALADEPYILHFATVNVKRVADQTLHALQTEQLKDSRLVAVKQTLSGAFVQVPVEYLLILKGIELHPNEILEYQDYATAHESDVNSYFQDHVMADLVQKHRQQLLEATPERESGLIRGFSFEESELAQRRSRLNQKAREGDSKAAQELILVKEQQSNLAKRRDEALAALNREPELIQAGDITFIAKALVLPTTEKKEQERQNAEVEAIAMRIARAHEESYQAKVMDVSKPDGARLAGLVDYPGFDLLSKHPNGTERAIEVKGKVGTGAVEVTDNEWSKACNLRDRYWLYVVFDCASPNPQLRRVQDPWARLLAKSKGSVLINAGAIQEQAEDDLT